MRIINDNKLSKPYVPSIVVQLKDFYGDKLYNIGSYSTIQSHLSVLAEHMYEGVQENHNAIITEISNYHKDFLGKEEEINKHSFSLADCQQAIANEYGFTNWQELSHNTNQPYNKKFELAINLLLDGNLSLLG